MPTRLRHLIARALPVVIVVLGLLVGHPERASAATSTASCSAERATVSPPAGGHAYYLFESNGTVVSCGGAPLHGSETAAKLGAPVTSGAATSAGSGYWLVAADGDVAPFGTAGFFGSPVHLHLRSPISAFAPTPDGGGYWLVSAKGNLFHFGDAHFFGSTVHDQKDGTVVALVPTPDGGGYWVVTATGAVRSFGDAAVLGPLAHPPRPVVAATTNPSGKGLWLITADGGVHNLGAASFFGSLVHRRLPRPPAAFAATNDGAGYLVATGSGGVFNFGDAPFDGSLARTPPRRPVGVVGIGAVELPAPPPPTTLPTAPTAPTTPTLPTAPTAPTTPTTPTMPSAPSLPHGQFGYDISNYQCASPTSSLASPLLPVSSPFSTLEVAGWLDGSYNPCLAGEASWATTAAAAAGAPYSLNVFLNSPDQSSAAAALDASGPGGTCATLTSSAQAACLAYNYGYEGAAAAFNYATSQGVSSSLWWVDVENSHLSATTWSNFSAGNYWSSSASLNAGTIEGAIDALRAEGVVVGVYSSSLQFPLIVAAYVPSGSQVPLWVAGVPWTSPPYTESGLESAAVLVGWCAGTVGYSSQAPTDLFAGGVPWLLQETPGSEPSPYGIDPDYVC